MARGDSLPNNIKVKFNDANHPLLSDVMCSFRRTNANETIINLIEHHSKVNAEAFQIIREANEKLQHRKHDDRVTDSGQKLRDQIAQISSDRAAIP